MSFLPIVSPFPKILVLGTMPSLKSIEIEEYYGHPQNSFWWIMSQIAVFPVELSYVERVKKIQEAGVCVWDVLNSCQRIGSLDSNIVRDSEVPNDVVGFLKRKPSISLVGFNGVAAKTIFERHNGKLCDGVALSQLPSTSPAYASMRKEQKLVVWRDAIAPHLNRA